MPTSPLRRDLQNSVAGNCLSRFYAYYIQSTPWQETGSASRADYSGTAAKPANAAVARPLSMGPNRFPSSQIIAFNFEFRIFLGFHHSYESLSVWPLYLSVSRHQRVLCSPLDTREYSWQKFEKRRGDGAAADGLAKGLSCCSCSMLFCSALPTPTLLASCLKKYCMLPFPTWLVV